MSKAVKPAALPAYFKAYDIRGRVPAEIDGCFYWLMGKAYAEIMNAARVVVGHDVRLSSPGLYKALCLGLKAGGAKELVGLGLCATEEMYYAVQRLKADGGIMVTASHNPADYNGMKLVKDEAKPISLSSELYAVAQRAMAIASEDCPPDGRLYEREKEPADEYCHKGREEREEYIKHLLSYIDIKKMKPLKIVANAGNGGAGAIIDMLCAHLPFEFIRLCWQPDGSFPNGVPNPLLPENRIATAKAVVEHKADLGLAWDGDVDRCFFFDENGGFIEGYYMVGLLARSVLLAEPGAKIVHDPRLVFNTVEQVKKAGGQPVMSKAGHTLFKETMRRENAVYGGEMSAHHYFRDFGYCDSGMIPWLLVCRLLSESKESLGQMVAVAQQDFPVSGEINRKVENPETVLSRVKEWCDRIPGEFDYTDGLSFVSDKFRLNLRSSNTEPLIRLNIETRGDSELLKSIQQQVLALY